MGKSISRAIVSVIRAIEYGFWVVGVLLIALAAVLASWGCFVYFTKVRTLLMPDPGLLRVLHDIVSTSLVYNMVFNYYYCAATDPGTSPNTEIDAETQRLIQEQQREQKAEPRDGGKFSIYCKHCQKLKPPRCHHCHICKRCVLRMDHHCPWLNTCIGHFNIRYFILFLFYASVSCGWAGIATGLILFSDNEIIFTTEDEYPILMLFVLTVAVSATTFIFLFWNLFLIGSGQTAVEYAHNRKMSAEAKSQGKNYQNIYNLGKLRNLEDIMLRGSGKSWWTAFMPTIQPPEGNGLSYSTREDVTFKDV